MGPMNDKLGSKKTSFVNVTLVVITIAMTVENIVDLRYNYTSFLMCFLWGFMDAAINIHSNAICSF